MLQDPVKGVLVPLAPDEVETVSSVAVVFDPGASYSHGAWSGLGEVALASADRRFPCCAALAALPALPDPTQVAYADCFSRMISGQHAAAGAGFAALALAGVNSASALYGVALALEKLGLLEEAENLAAFVAELPGYNDPRAAALAGYAAYQRRQTKAARAHLARAARLAQRVLLMQQFALGD